jgi:MGT family glycosyltransferase
VAEIVREKPDALLHDSLSLWGKIAGLKTHTPTVALVPSMAINSRVILSQTPLLLDDYANALAHPVAFSGIVFKFFTTYVKRGLLPPSFFDIFSNSEKLNIVFTSRQFQPLEHTFDEKHQFAGPIIYDRNEQQSKLTTKKNQPIIYVALGTVYNDNIHVYKSILAVLKKIGFESYVSIGSYISIDELGDLPSHIHIAPYFPQLEILAKASVFISHCGMNSVNESLYFGVPLLMLPIIQEQKMNAQRVEELGAGIYYKKQVIDDPQFAESIHSLLNDSKYAKAAQSVGKQLLESGGAKKAVERILEFVAEGEGFEPTGPESHGFQDRCN